MLALLLTRQRLKSEAPLWFDKGLDYWKDKRVVARTSREDEILGVVRGTREYDVRVFATQRGRLAAECTCPDIDPDRRRRVLCKHAIALALDHIDGGQEVPSIFSDVGAWAPRPAGWTFATRDQLEEWARAQHVENELAVSAECLHDDLVKRSFGAHVDVLSSVTLREVASVDSARRVVGGSGGARAVAAAAVRWLERAAADVRIGLEEENQARIAADDDGLSRPWRQLLLLRTDLRDRGAFPRSRSTWARGTLDFDGDAGALVWREPVTVGGPRSAMVPIETRLIVGPPRTMSCACGAEACTHGLALVDASLDLLGDPTRRGRARELAALMDTHPSERALAALSAYANRPRAATIQVSWEIRVDPEGRTPAVLAALVRKPLVKGGLMGRFQKGASGWGSPMRVAATAMLSEYGAVLDDHDARIADHLAAWQPSLTTQLPRRAFAALVGHPRALVADALDQGVELVACALAFDVRAVGDAVEVVPVAAGVALDPEVLGNAISGGLPGEPVILVDRGRAGARCLLIDISDAAHHAWRVLERHGRAFRATDLAAVRARLAALGVDHVQLRIANSKRPNG